MHTDGTDGLQEPAWAAGLLRQLGQSGRRRRRSSPSGFRRTIQA